MAFSLVTCFYCHKTFSKDNRHINENIKLGNKFYCSTQCQSSFKNKQKQYLCENPGCTNKFLRTPGSVSFRNFCSSSCSATFYNKGRVRNKSGYNGSDKSVINYHKSMLSDIKPIYCKYCGNKASYGHNYCSNKCWAKDHEISKEELIKQLQILALKLGRSPTRRECKHFSSCAKYFGTWNNALIAAGLTPHRSLNQKMYSRRKCFAKDGHSCNSVSELIIDNWLYKNNIVHKKETPYPIGKFTADWSLSEKTFIEYFGLAKDSRRYDLEILKKQEVCKKSGINLIEIYSKDLFPANKLDQIFKTTLN